MGILASTGLSSTHSRGKRTGPRLYGPTDVPTHCLATRCISASRESARTVRHSLQLLQGNRGLYPPGRI